MNEKYIKAGLHEVLGPLVANASDGDARRRTVQLSRMMNNASGYKPVDHEYFPFVFIVNADGVPILLGDQDWIQYGGICFDGNVHS
jgi:hypothetical protein